MKALEQSAPTRAKSALVGFLFLVPLAFYAISYAITDKQPQTPIDKTTPYIRHKRFWCTISRHASTRMNIMPEIKHPNVGVQISPDAPYI